MNTTAEKLIDAAIAAFNADDSKTHRSNPDPREHYYARRPILAEDCDYEIVGFSGVRACYLPDRDTNEQAAENVADQLSETGEFSDGLSQECTQNRDSGK